jgi:hypothetical protein
MIYQVGFQRKQVAKDPRSQCGESFLVDSSREPTRDEILQLVGRRTAGDFAPESVEIEAYPGVKVSELSESTILKLD